MIGSRRIWTKEAVWKSQPIIGPKRRLHLRWLCLLWFAAGAITASGLGALLG